MVDSSVVVLQHCITSKVRSHATQKLGQISKIQFDQISILCTSLRISSHLFASSVLNGKKDRC